MTPVPTQEVPDATQPSGCSRLRYGIGRRRLRLDGASPAATTPRAPPRRRAPSTPASTEVETHTPTAGGPVTLTVAGVGTVTLTVDPTTAAISDVVVTPIDGVTTGAPVATPDGVKIQVTAADGTVPRARDQGPPRGRRPRGRDRARGREPRRQRRPRQRPRRRPGRQLGFEPRSGQRAGRPAGQPGPRRRSEPRHDRDHRGAPGVFSPGTSGDDHGANSGHDGGGDDASGGSDGGHSGRG